MLIRTTIDGIGITVDVTVNYVEHPNRNADNSADYYGYADFEYELLHSSNTDFSEAEWDEMIDIYENLSENDVFLFENKIETIIMNRYRRI